MGRWQITIEEHGSRVWNIVYRILGNDADASDCFQEVFLTAVESSRKRKIRNMPAFLSLVASQRAIDALRKRNTSLRQKTHSADCQLLETSDPAPDDCLQSTELSEQLRDALMKIPPIEAQVFCLRTLNEFSYRQIAEEMNVNENYVGVLINRAKAKLRNLLETVSVNHEYGREVANDS